MTAITYTSAASLGQRDIPGMNILKHQELGSRDKQRSIITFVLKYPIPMSVCHLLGLARFNAHIIVVLVRL
jgi:hypothetical protein